VDALKVIVMKNNEDGKMSVKRSAFGGLVIAIALTGAASIVAPADGWAVSNSLAVQILESPNQVAAGNDAAFDVAVTNTTSSSISNVSLQFGGVVSGTQERPPVISPTSCPGSAGSDVCPLGDLGPGQSVSTQVTLGTSYDEQGAVLTLSATALASNSAVTGNLSTASVEIGDAASPGYNLVASDGGLFSFDGTFSGSLGSQTLDAPIVDTTSTPDGRGYWMVASDGGVFAFGDAQFLGSGVGLLKAPAVAISVDSSGSGYAIAAADGEIWQFLPGEQPQEVFSLSGPLAKPIVGLVRSGSGYILVASDGGVFADNAPFYGSMGGQALNQPIVGVASDLVTGGYWLVASDGGVFSFNAPFEGSTGAIPLNKPIVGMISDPATDGYWLVASDGGVFSFNAPFRGSTGGIDLNEPIVGMAVAATPGNTIQESSRVS
jgi:hypothetical protein